LCPAVSAAGEHRTQTKVTTSRFDLRAKGKIENAHS
jgi:hypothetical protein